MFQFIPISCFVFGHHWRKDCSVACPALRGCFAGWITPGLSSTPCISDAVVPYPILWPITGLSIAFSLSFLHQWAQHWTWHLLMTHWGWHRGRSTSLDLFSMLCLIPPRTQLSTFYTRLCCGKWCLHMFLLEKELWDWKLFWTAGFLIYTKHWCQWDIFMSEWFRDAKNVP